MTLYAESSAILAWLMDQPGGSHAYEYLGRADMVVTSELTLIECDRTLHRHRATGTVQPAVVDGLQAELAEVASGWNLQPMTPDIVLRARGRFPDDTIRSLDAIHLASGLIARTALGEIDLLSLDERIRTAGARLGFRVVPE